MFSACCCELFNMGSVRINQYSQIQLYCVCYCARLLSIENATEQEIHYFHTHNITPAG